MNPASTPVAPLRDKAGGSPWLVACRVALVLVPVLAVVLDASTPPKVIKDEVQHLAYLRSLVLDRDLDFSNDFQALWPKFQKHPWRVERTGRPPNTAALGAPLLWAPAFVVAHAFGSNLVEREACVLTSSLLFSLGVLLAYRIAKDRFGPLAAALGTALVTGASFYGYWWLYPGLFAHAPAIGVICCFVFLWLRHLGSTEPGRWIRLGLLAGFLTVVRWQNVWLPFLCGAVELTWLLLGWIGGETGMEGEDAPVEVLAAWARRRRVLVCAVAYAASTFVGLAPQLLAWKAIYGTYIPRTGGSTFLQWLKPYWIDLLFSPRYGLLGFSPWLYVPVAGLLVAAVRFRREPLWLVGGLYALLAIYLNSCLASVSWYGGATFGPRRLDSLFPFLVLGGAYAVDRLMAWWRRSPAIPVACATGAGIVWTLTMASAYRAGSINVGMVGAERFAWQAPNAFVDRLGWPPSWPGELYYVLRDRLRWGQYTQLAGADPVPFGDGKIDLTRVDRLHLSRGWRLGQAAVADLARSNRSDDVFVYVMDLGLREHDIRVDVRGLPAHEAGSIVVNGTAVRATTDEGWQALVPRGMWRPGVNRIAFQRDATSGTASSPSFELTELRLANVGGEAGDD